MKKIMLYFFISICCDLLQAQESLTLHITPGTLKDNLTETQLAKVKKLTLIGGMNDNDFVIFREYMPQLEELVMREVDIEEIPAKAFCKSNIYYLELPEKLKSIGDSAFYSLRSIGINLTIAGEFPILKGNVFANAIRHFYVDENNLYCKMTDNEFIYSMDDKILYAAPMGAIIRIPEGVEIIYRGAFQNCWIDYGEIVIPSSVRVIGGHAFDNVESVEPVRSGGVVSYTCWASEPPILDGEVFNKENVGYTYLFVLEESVELYKASPQWNEFRCISGTHLPQGISNNEVSFLRMNISDNNLHIDSEKNIYSVEIVNIDGYIIYKKVTDNSFSLNIPICGKFVGLLQVVYKDGDREVIKLNF